MVPGGRALRGADGTTAPTSGARRPRPPGRDASRSAAAIADPFADAGTDDGRRGVRQFCRNRPAGDYSPTGPTAMRSQPPQARQGIRVADDDTWSRSVQPRAGRAHRAAPGHRPRDDPLRISDTRSGSGAALARRSARRRTFRALRLRRRARQRVRRTHRRRRAAPPLRSRNGGEGARLRRTLSDRRGFPRRAGAHAAGVRHRARLRPAGDAGDRRVAHRAGAVDAGGRAGLDRAA